MLILDHPLALLPLALVPVWAGVLSARGLPTLGATPPDPVSRLVDHTLRAAGIVGLGALALGLAGPHLPGGTVLRAATGAHLVLLIDRSSSMDNTFADKRPDGSAEAKSAAAGCATSSTAAAKTGWRWRPSGPRLGAADRPARGGARRGAGHRRTGAGANRCRAGSGARLRPLRRRHPRRRARRRAGVGRGGGDRARRAIGAAGPGGAPGGDALLALSRSHGSKGIFEPPDPAKPDTPQTRPERHLHLFPQTLGVPYRAFEAESPEAVRDAIAAIDTLESRPMVVAQGVPRRALAPWLYGLAAGCLALLTLARPAERPGVAAAPRPLMRRPGDPA